MKKKKSLSENFKLFLALLFKAIGEMSIISASIYGAINIYFRGIKETLFSIMLMILFILLVLASVFLNFIGDSILDFLKSNQETVKSKNRTSKKEMGLKQKQRMGR
jgi:hypothetical protein